MEKEDRLNSLITGQTEEVCDNCKYFIFDDKDPQGVGGTCIKDGEFCFCFEHCSKHEKRCCDFQQQEDNDDSYEKVISDYKCPICNSRIIQNVSQFATGSVHCENDCFQRQTPIYAECPICKKGFMKNPIYHGTMYLSCDNCGFEIDPLDLITWILKGN